MKKKAYSMLDLLNELTGEHPMNHLKNTKKPNSHMKACDKNSLIKESRDKFIADIRKYFNSILKLMESNDHEEILDVYALVIARCNTFSFFAADQRQDIMTLQDLVESNKHKNRKDYYDEN